MGRGLWWKVSVDFCRARSKARRGQVYIYIYILHEVRTRDISCCMLPCKKRRRDSMFFLFLAPPPHHLTHGLARPLSHSGSSKGGDCDHLLLASSPGATPINLRAHGGEILLHGTHVESWDMAAKSVHEDYEGGRRCVVVLVLLPAKQKKSYLFLRPSVSCLIFLPAQ